MSYPSVFFVAWPGPWEARHVARPLGRPRHGERPGDLPELCRADGLLF
jgi:hypothetical protein